MLLKGAQGGTLAIQAAATLDEQGDIAGKDHHPCGKIGVIVDHLGQAGDAAFDQVTWHNEQADGKCLQQGTECDQEIICAIPPRKTTKY